MEYKTDPHEAARRAARAFAASKTASEAQLQFDAVCEWLADDVPEDADLEAAAAQVIHAVTRLDAEAHIISLPQ